MKDKKVIYETVILRELTFKKGDTIPGADLVTYYDKTFRIEYSVNGFGKGGLYFGLSAHLNR